MTTLTFSGTPGASWAGDPNYTSLQGAVIYSASGAGVCPGGAGVFSQITKNTAMTGVTTVTALIRRTVVDGSSESGISIVNGSSSGFSVFMSGATLYARNEVSGSPGSDIGNASITQAVGVDTLELEFDSTSNFFSVKHNGVTKISNIYSGGATGLRAGWQSYRTGGEVMSLESLNDAEAAAATIDSISSVGNPGGLVVGEAFVITTTNMTDLVDVSVRTTGVLNAVTSAINLDAPGGDGTGQLKFWVDGEYYPFIGAVNVDATDLVNSPDIDVTLALPDNHVSVTFSSVVTTDNTYIGYWLDALGHPLADGEYGYYINSNGLVIDPNSAVHCLSAMTFLLWVHKENAIIEGYTIIVNDAGQITDARRISSRYISSRKITNRSISSRHIS